MATTDKINRVEFLGEKFGVFDDSSEESIESEIKTLISEGQFSDVKPFRGGNGDIVIALICVQEVSKKSSSGETIVKLSKGIRVAYSVFKSMLSSDPTKKKKYTQWMLEVFSRLLKESKYSDADRFVTEDLPLATEYLTLFEHHKKKKLFKELARESYALKGIVEDPTNINQYKSLSTLYDAVDPFIERDSSEMEKLIKTYIDSGMADLVVKDRKFSVIIPRDVKFCIIFDKFVAWCTSKPGNGMFSNYTTSRTYNRPNGKNSELYIIIDHKFFNGDLSDGSLYQIHFESKQVRNRKQNNKTSFYLDVLEKSVAVSNYFNEVLTINAKQVGNVNNNLYVDYLIKFGWTEALFEMMDDFTPIIKFMNKELPRIPDVSKFKDLHTLIVAKSKLRHIDSSIGSLQNLKELLLPQNNITILPKEIGNLKNMIMLNLLGNKLEKIPDEIKYLDKTNGGSLYRLSVSREDVGEKNYRKLKNLLPSVKM
tara:strand:- start:5945 stop:7390 length:1446 start_codon:yes stop_codon:yes gene_type:complete